MSKQETNETFSASNIVHLPVGIEHEGIRYRKVEIDAMTGYDQRNMSSRKNKRNAEKSLNALFRRSIQEIEGLVPKKSSPNSMIEDRVVKRMVMPDRIFLFMAIKALDSSTFFQYNQQCRRCESIIDCDVDLAELPIYDWPEGEPTEIPLELTRGIYLDGEFRKNVVVTWLDGSEAERVAKLPEEKQLGARLARIIKRVEGYDGPVDTEAVLGMTAKDIECVLTEVDRHSPGLDLMQSYTCPDCGHEFDAMIDIRAFLEGGSDRKGKAQTSRLKRRKR